EICGQAQDLSSAYMLSESSEPSLVLIGSELIRLPDFEGLLSLFRVSETAWLEIPENLQGDTRQAGGEAATQASLLQWLETAKRPSPVGAPSTPRPVTTSAQTGVSGSFLADRL